MTMTLEKTDEAIIAETKAKLGGGKVWCFMAGMHPHPKMNSYLLGVAVLGEAGWRTTSLSFDTFNECSDRADVLNKLLPYSVETCIAIVADTMSRSRLKQEQEHAARNPLDREFKVTVSFVDEAHMLQHEDDVIEMIRDTLGDEYTTLGITSVEAEGK